MVRQPGTNGKGNRWTTDDVRKLRKLAREGTAEAAADVLSRTVLAVRQKAMKCGISFRPLQPASMRDSEFQLLGDRSRQDSSGRQ
jgi:hypothetical protein